MKDHSTTLSNSDTVGLRGGLVPDAVGNLSRQATRFRTHDQLIGDPPVDPKKLSGKLPWITREGYFDPAQFPIDGVLIQALSEDDDQFRSGLNLLRSMYGHGRQEAGVFLLGLLVNCDDLWEKRIRIVEALQEIDTKPCADLLFGELKRVRSSNTTRRYLAAVIKVLATMPTELIEAGFESLAQDKAFSQKMRDKFKAVLRQDRLDDEFPW